MCHLCSCSSRLKSFEQRPSLHYNPCIPNQKFLFFIRTFFKNIVHPIIDLDLCVYVLIEHFFGEVCIADVLSNVYSFLPTFTDIWLDQLTANLTFPFQYLHAYISQLKNIAWVAKVAPLTNNCQSHSYVINIFLVPPASLIPLAFPIY